MAGFIKCAVLIVFLLAIAPPLPHPIQCIPRRPRDDFGFLCAMLVSTLALWYLPGADGRGRLFRGLMVLGCGTRLSAASCFLLLSPFVAYTIAGSNGTVALAVAGAVWVAAGAGALWDRLA